MGYAAYSLHQKSPIRSWEELVALDNQFSGTEMWAFRGQNCLEFPTTSLERHCKDLGLKGARCVDLEVKLIRDFARRYHLYSGTMPPPKGHTLEWLSLLRHYGTPTRLVDFTYSLFVAVHFALEAAETSAVVWAVNLKRLFSEAEKHIATRMTDGRSRIEEFRQKRDGAEFRALFMNKSPFRFVYSTNPIRLNERLTNQQGLFLVPGDVTATFEENIRAVPNHRKCVVKIVVHSSCRVEVLRRLYRLGINAATLFPGLDGFARSLRTKSLILARLPRETVEMLEQV